MASYSVNLTNDEWEFVLEELFQRRQNDFREEEDLKHLISISNRITKKIKNKNKSKNNSKYSSWTKTELCEKIEELEKEILQMKLSNRERQKEELEKEKQKDRLEVEICDLKILIDKQHEELQQIKNKLKEIISS